MRIDQRINREKYRFYVQFNYNEMTCTVSAPLLNLECAAKVSDDFYQIIFDEPKLIPNMYDGKIKIDRIHLNSKGTTEAKECNPKHVINF